MTLKLLGNDLQAKSNYNAVNQTTHTEELEDGVVFSPPKPAV